VKIPITIISSDTKREIGLTFTDMSGATDSVCPIKRLSGDQQVLSNVRVM
jgi:hypothetical protein